MDSSNIQNFLDRLETGDIRSASLQEGQWRVHPEVKEGILATIRAGKLVQMGPFVDKDTIPAQSFNPERRVRFVPGGSSVRRGAYVAATVVIMPPAYVNIGAYIDEGTMVDSHVLVGSCAQIGKRVHLSAGVQIGGVLEPVGQMPVIVEDDAFIGAQCVVVEGIRVGRRAVLAPGVVLSRGVAIYDAVNQSVLERGAAVPENAVLVPGSRPLRSEWAREQGLQVSCPVIIKYRDEKSDASLVLESVIREGL